MRKISYIQLHESGTFAPDFIPNIGAMLPPMGKTIKGLTLWDDGNKVLVRIEADGKVKEGFIPITNVKLAVYDKIDAIKAKSKGPDTPAA